MTPERYAEITALAATGAADVEGGASPLIVAVDLAEREAIDDPVEQDVLYTTLRGSSPAFRVGFGPE